MELTRVTGQMERKTIRQASGSPLDSLVRHASSRRANATMQASPHTNMTISTPSTPPRLNVGGPGAAQQSPLLHTRFRTSTTTFNDYDSTISDARSMASWTTRDESHQGRRPPHESVVSAASYDFDDITAHYRESWHSSDTMAKEGESSQPSPIPNVVVTPGNGNESAYAGVQNGSRGGRAPSRVQSSGNLNVNFSRPGLPPVDKSEERKRQVLMRHQQPPPSPFSPPQGYSFEQPVDVSAMRPRPASPTSAYSTYSYNPLNAGAPPLPHASLPPPAQAMLTPNPYVPAQPNRSRAPSPHALAPSPTPASPSQGLKTPQEYLQLGIQHHEANRLTESAACFEKSATLGGGCGVGMLMWGLAQRHGWGCEKSERAGFRWLRRAAEVAVVDLEGSRVGVDVPAVKSELTIAVYEVGQSFYRGWGVEKDKKMAVSYFRLAARMGDPDAQQELAFCLANGKGCKKDMREAAKWYREAVAQGASDIGLAWIYKEKYQ